MKTPPPVETPELKKLSSVKVESQAIGEFIEWLQSQGVTLAQYHKHSHACRDSLRLISCGLRTDELYSYQYGSIEKLLARYFEIDLAKVERERLALLKQIRAQNAALQNG